MLALTQALGSTAVDPAAEHGRSDRTRLLRAAIGLRARGRPLPGRVERALLRRGQVSVLLGLGTGLAFPARALPPDHAHAHLLLLGQLEPAVQEALRRELPAGGCLWDAGANIGFFSALGARLAGEGGSVLAFEPVPSAAAHAREAAARSGLAEQVEVREQAVGARAGREELWITGDGSWSHLAARGNRTALRAEIEVEVTTLDDVLATGARPPDVVKLDVEGSEADVLRGAQRLLAEHGPVVVVELHDTRDEVCDVLDAAGYATSCLDAAVPARAASGDGHLLARPLTAG